tara:strand:- start:2158 stop:2340 length:183 start_codon:yes stop_codon:yes gene_type:complete
MKNLFENFESLENQMVKQAKTKEAKSIVRETIRTSKESRLTTRETFTKINLIIVGSLGIC